MTYYQRRTRQGIYWGFLVLLLAGCFLFLYLSGYGIQITHNGVSLQDKIQANQGQQTVAEGDEQKESSNAAANDSARWDGTAAVNQATVLILENSYLCGDNELVEWIPADEDWYGLTYNELLQKLQPDVVWDSNRSGDNQLVLTTELTEYCSSHKQWRHLGIADNKLAVFQGPLGNNSILLQTEDIAIADLSKELQQTLLLAMNFDQQSAEVQKKLCTDASNKMEFSSESELNLVLQNFDEYVAETNDNEISGS